DMPDDSPKQFGAEVIVTTRDGKRLSRRIDHLVCRGGDYPMTDEELFEKFEDCAGRALAHDQIMPLYERLETLDKVADMTQVMRLLEPRKLPVETAQEIVSGKTRVVAGSGESHFVP
ncbi:MAG TPA: hypothetical protein VFV47_06915, partial [Hyphomicrobiaceae bacterium]|nr:hypothetical protein [Hyphomicrobiaceae bacterium]